MQSSLVNGECQAIMERCRDASARICERRKVLRQEMKHLGGELLRAKGMVPHGLWTSVLHEYGIHQRTAQRAILLARGIGQENPLPKRHVSYLGEGGNGGRGADSADFSGADTFNGASIDDDMRDVVVEDLDDGEAGELGAVGTQLGLSEIYERMDAARARVMLRLDRLQSRGDVAALAEMERMAGGA